MWYRYPITHWLPAIASVVKRQTKGLTVVLILSISLAALACTQIFKPPVAHSSQPMSIVFILTDDMRQDFLTGMNFFRDGKWINFTDATVEVPMCCPSRSSILNGSYASRNGVLTNSSGKNFDASKTVATYMHAAGYRTGLSGKYLNYFPWDLGSDYKPAGWDFWHPELSSTALSSTLINPNAKPDSTDKIFADAAQFISSTSTSQPFFLYLAPNAPHQPAVPESQYASSMPPLPALSPAFNEADLSDKPASIRSSAGPVLTSTQIAAVQHERLQSARTLLSVDEDIQNLIAQLTRAGRIDNTMIVFASDNGYGFNDHRLDKKGYAYESMVLTPLLVRYPGQAGRNSTAPVSLTDLTATFADVADGKSHTLPGVDGSSFLPLLKSAAASFARPVAFVEGPARQDRWYSVRSHAFKYILWDDKAEELYDLAKDPYELSNVAKNPAYGSTLSQYRTYLATYRKGGTAEGRAIGLKGDLADEEAPKIISVSLAKTVKTGGSVTATVKASDNRAVYSVEFFLDETLIDAQIDPASGTPANGSYPVTFTTSGFKTGTHSLKILVTDDVELETAQTFSFQVL